MLTSREHRPLIETPSGRIAMKTVLIGSGNKSKRTFLEQFFAELPIRFCSPQDLGIDIELEEPGSSSNNCVVGDFPSSAQPWLPDLQLDSGECRATQPFSKPCATLSSTRSASLVWPSSRLLNLIESPGTDPYARLECGQKDKGDRG